MRDIGKNPSLFHRFCDRTKRYMGNGAGAHLPKLPGIWNWCYVLFIFHQLVIAHLAFPSQEPEVLRIQWYLEFLFMSISLVCYILIVVILRNYKFTLAAFFLCLTIVVIVYFPLPVFLLNDGTIHLTIPLFRKCSLILQSEGYLTLIFYFFTGFTILHFLYYIFGKVNYDYLNFNVTARCFMIGFLLFFRAYLFLIDIIASEIMYGWLFAVVIFLGVLAVVLKSTVLQQIKDPTIFNYTRLILLITFDLGFIAFLYLA